MARETDERADVVHQGGVFEPFALAVGQAVDGARLIEQCQRQLHDLLRVLRVVVAALGQFQHAAAPHVGNPLDVDDLLLVPADVVEHQPFAQREVAQREILGAEPLQDGVEQHGTGDDEIGAARVESGQRQAFLVVQLDDLPPQPANLLGRHAQVAQFRGRHAAGGGGRDVPRLRMVPDVPITRSKPAATICLQMPSMPWRTCLVSAVRRGR